MSPDPPSSVLLARHADDDRANLFDEDFLRKLEYLHVVSRKVFSGRLFGDRRARKMGSGIEFADHRRYAFGDDFRYIDWNVYGRIDRLLLRLFEEEEDLHIYLLLDCSRSMQTGAPQKLWDAVRPAVIAADPTFAGDATAFCDAYGKNRYAPDWRP